MARLARPDPTVFGVDIVQFIENDLHFVRSRHDVAAGPDPLTEEMLMLNNIPQQGRTGRMLERQHKRVRTRSIEFFDKTSLNPTLKTTIFDREEISQQLRQHLSVRLVLCNIPVQPHNMPRITPPRLRDKVTSKIIKVIVLLETHATTRTLRQSLSTFYNGNSLGSRPRSF